jgi:hypothetical protein
VGRIEFSWWDVSPDIHDLVFDKLTVSGLLSGIQVSMILFGMNYAGLKVDSLSTERRGVLLSALERTVETMDSRALAVSIQA